jgi:hypothetical protein
METSEAGVAVTENATEAPETRLCLDSHQPNLETSTSRMAPARFDDMIAGQPTLDSMLGDCDDTEPVAIPAEVGETGSAVSTIYEATHSAPVDLESSKQGATEIGESGALRQAQACAAERGQNVAQYGCSFVAAVESSTSVVLEQSEAAAPMLPTVKAAGRDSEGEAAHPAAPAVAAEAAGERAALAADFACRMMAEAETAGGHEANAHQVRELAVQLSKAQACEAEGQHTGSPSWPDMFIFTYGSSAVLTEGPKQDREAHTAQNEDVAEGRVLAATSHADPSLHSSDQSFVRGPGQETLACSCEATPRGGLSGGFADDDDEDAWGRKVDAGGQRRDTAQARRSAAELFSSGGAVDSPLLSLKQQLAALEVEYKEKLQAALPAALVQKRRLGLVWQDEAAEGVRCPQ